ncbi:hypothetical protein IEO21_00447 [Rhodonia placenta]|uniref:ABM domain-containing protein n=1 Tax=Rhodonia placenta TaxID=104341 RepID=A0A8H7U7N4_9APHY|nr:hypothetical protein IEO21_00447 [Postia placenta]
MPLVVEIADALAADAFLASPRDPNLVKPALDIVAEAQGSLRTYYGLQTEERKHSYLVNVWDAIQSHHDLQANKAVYGEFKKNITSLAKSHPDILHVQIKNGDPYKALNAPVTAFTTITLKPGESKELLEEKVREVTEAGNSIPASWGSYGIVSGPIIEKEATYALIIGWDSAEAHWKTVTTVPELVNPLTEIRGLADIGSAHVALVEYKRQD